MYRQSALHWHWCQSGSEFADALGDQTKPETMQHSATRHGSHGRLIEELDGVLRRGLRLLDEARSDTLGLELGERELPELPFGKDELPNPPQISGLAKTHGWERFELLEAVPQPNVFGKLKAGDDQSVIWKPADTTVAAPKTCDDEVVIRNSAVTSGAAREDTTRNHESIRRAPTSFSLRSKDRDRDLVLAKPRENGIHDDAPETIDTELISSDAPNVSRTASSDPELGVGLRFSQKINQLLSGDFGHSGFSTETSLVSVSSQRTVSFAATGPRVVKPASQHGKCANALEIFLDDPDSSPLAGYFNIMVTIIIQFSVVLSLVQTIESPPLDMDTFVFIQITLDAFFVIELVLRLCVCSNVRLFLLNAHNIIDLIAAALPLSLRAARSLGYVDVEDDGIANYIVFCVAPPLREMKILRRVQQFHLFVRVLRDIREAVQTLLMLLMMMVLVFSSLLYIFEPRENIPSMPRAVWLTIVTMTTVGYGDITPESTPGHIIASLLALCSVLYMAMPIGIIGNAFTQTWHERDYILLMIKTRGAMMKLGYNASDLPAIFQHYSNGSGELVLENFMSMVSDMNLGLSQDRALKVFEAIDRDGGGSVDEQEFVRSVFPSAYHDLYQGRSSGSCDGDDPSMTAKAVEKLRKFGRTISPGAMEVLENTARQMSPGSRSSPRSTPRNSEAGI